MFRIPMPGWLRDVAPPKPGSRPAGLPPRPGVPPQGPPPRPMPGHMRLDNLGPRPDLVVCVAPRSLGLAAMRSKIARLESERNRLLANAAAALERIEVADRDKGGAVAEAEAILASVVRLDGTYVQDAGAHAHEWHQLAGSIGRLACAVPGCDARTTRAALITQDHGFTRRGLGEPSDF